MRLSGCPDCERVPATAGQVESCGLAVRELVPAVRDLELRQRQLSAELRSVLGGLRHARRELAQIVGRHPKCATCGLLAGPGHAVDLLSVEPFGRELVCRECRRELERRKLSAAQWVRLQVEADAAESATTRVALSG